MGKESAGMQILRSNWHLLIALTLVLVAAVVLALRPENASKADASAPVQMEVRETLQSETMSPKSRWTKQSRDEKVQESIDQYTHEIEQNDSSEETPHNLYRLANLYYAEERDYDKASLYYLRLLQEYPDYKSIQEVFVNLAVCYEQLGQYDFKRNVLKQMMEHYGEGTEQYQYAQHELSGS